MSNKLKAVVAGTGWGAVHARGFAESEHSELCAVWSRTDKPEARRQAKLLGVPLYTDYGRMLAEIRPALVGVAVQEAGHAEFAIKAMQAGAHVYCEKVLSDSQPEAKRMAEVSRATGRALSVGYNYRYSASCQYLSKVVQSGVLGPLLFAQLRAFTWCVHHMTDYALSLLGQPVQVSATLEMDPLPGHSLRSEPAHCFPTFVYAAFRKKVYTVQFENGALLQAAATDYAPSEEPGATLLVQGALGRAELDDLSGNVVVRCQGREARLFTPSQIRDRIGLVENGVVAVLDFARAMAAGEPAPIPADPDGIRMIALEEAIQRSARHGMAWEKV